MNLTSALMGALLYSTLPNGSPALNPLNSIPLRCIGAMDDGEEAYLICRYQTLEKELLGVCHGHTAWTYNDCMNEEINKAAHNEYKVLRSLAEQKQK